MTDPFTPERKTRPGFTGKGDEQQRSGKQMYLGRPSCDPLEKGESRPCLRPGDFPSLASDPDKRVLTVTSLLFKVSQMSVFFPGYLSGGGTSLPSSLISLYIALHTHSALAVAGTQNSHCCLSAFVFRPISSPCLEHLPPRSTGCHLPGNPSRSHILFHNLK